MSTDSLIERLARDVTPIGRDFAARRIGIALAISAAVVLTLVIVLLGLRPDLGTAWVGDRFWTKLFYLMTAFLIVLPAGAAMRHPEAGVPRGAMIVVLPFAVMAAGAIAELSQLPADMRTAAWLGQTWRQCPILVLVLSLPIYGALVIAFRRFAPTRLAVTGGMLGLISGALAASLYSLHCPEVSLAFIATWYTLGILLACVAGTISGPRVLRW